MAVTAAVLGARHAARMVTKPLESGDEIRCPQCRRWHPVHQRHTEGTPYTLRMLYFECRASQYYAGQVGCASRHETRASPLAARQ